MLCNFEVGPERVKIYLKNSPTKKHFIPATAGSGDIYQVLVGAKLLDTVLVGAKLLDQVLVGAKLLD